MTGHRYLAVDRRNLFSWLSRGLIVPRALTDKYRSDALDTPVNALPMAAEAAIGFLSRSAEYPVCIELDPRVDLAPLTAEAGSAVVWARGAVSTRRIKRVHVRTESDLDEMRARAYRGFDANELDILVSPNLFVGDDLTAEWVRSGERNDTQLDGRNLRLRECVAGAVMSMFSGVTQSVPFHDQWPIHDEAEDVVRALVTSAQSSGLIKGQDDAVLLHGTLQAIFDLAGEGDIVPSELLTAISATSLDAPIAGLEKHLDRILQLTQGEDELKPFKGRGGLLTTKALLLYLLRPDPEAVRGWADEDLNTEVEVLQLSRLLAGFASRYGGLPSSLRKGAQGDELLDWTARGLQPSDFLMPTVARSIPATSADANPAVDALIRNVEAGEHTQALAVAHALGWSDCLQLQVTAHSFQTGTTDGKIDVKFTPGATLTWSLVPERIAERMSGLTDAELQTVLKPRRAAVRRPSAKSTRGVTAPADDKRAQDQSEVPSLPTAGEEEAIGRPSCR
ncbi:hypothetical protein [Mycolicibacterium sediminis]|uniref:Uncharacterized protein n=1 Tax=Mycolicibacterium sediminis TaxID=1286180 RepID=A0A7I7QP92_9MYCO|nr:hypothetical protein [Mycolicibacterium sediminis]BBY28095.1 hypothetical protein MSEDJ_21910 [Mycolicibacterium sediminis]